MNEVEKKIREVFNSHYNLATPSNDCINELLSLIQEERQGDIEVVWNETCKKIQREAVEGFLKYIRVDYRFEAEEYLKSLEDKDKEQDEN